VSTVPFVAARHRGKQTAVAVKGGREMMVERTAVLLDRQPLWLEGIERVLGRIEFTVVGKTTSPTVALKLVESHRPDVVINGIEMGPGEMDGIEFLRKARDRVPSLRAIVLSAKADPAWIDRALDAGAIAYVVKSAHPDDLSSAIRQAFEHSVYFAAARPTARPTPPVSEELAELTMRERQILQLVAEGHSNAQLAKMLWVTEQTVKFHLSNVYRKLNVANRTEASWWVQRNVPVAEDADTQTGVGELAEVRQISSV
jgi:DNA-binding NarL/FixJ family response regulator